MTSTFSSNLCSLLTIDCGLYLPPYKAVNIYFMKAVMEKEKRAIKVADVKYLFAPQYKSLSIPKLLEFAAEF